jgi:CheY-like chemotaxis protein
MPYGSVLIVDDVETNIYVAKGLLAPYKLNIDSVVSGFAAIEKIKSGSVYDIIFMDHMMPQMDGIEATKIIRDMGYDRSIVALTANAVAGQADIFLGNGFDDYISKPIDIRLLNSMLNKLIRDKHPPEVVDAARKLAEDEKEQPLDSIPQPALDQRVIEFFVRDALRALTALETVSQKNDYSNEDNIRTYIINVHGIKGALANIGKKDLSSAALKLEMAGREKKLDIIKSETPAFFSFLLALVDELTLQRETVDSAAEFTGENVNEDKSYLTKMLLEIREACAEYDEKAADKVLEELLQAEWSQHTKELLGAMTEQLLHSDFEEIVNDINEFIETHLQIFY